MKSEYRNNRRMQSVLRDRFAALFLALVGLGLILVAIYGHSVSSGTNLGQAIVLAVLALVGLALVVVGTLWWIGMNRQKHDVLEMEFGITKKRRQKI